MNKLTLDSLTQMLGNVSIFKSMPEVARREIVEAGQILTIPAGNTIFHEGDPCAGIYVLFSGQVHLYKLSIHGQETIIAIINPVIMFNEVSVLDGGPNPVTAIAAQDCALWRVECERYQALIDRYPEVGLGLLGVLAARNRFLLDRYEDMISRPVLARLAKILLDLSDKGQQPINRHNHTNLMIAALVATVPEAVSRSIKILREMSVIETTRSMITVTSTDKLVELAQIDPFEL
jgi:CRP/FNR family transcriptional regulator